MEGSTQTRYHSIVNPIVTTLNTESVAVTTKDVHRIWLGIAAVVSITGHGRLVSRTIDVSSPHLSIDGQSGLVIVVPHLVDIRCPVRCKCSAVHAQILCGRQDTKRLASSVKDTQLIPWLAISSSLSYQSVANIRDGT